MNDTGGLILVEDISVSQLEKWLEYHEYHEYHERTCHNISLKAHKGVFCCSECGIHVDIALMDSHDYYLPLFCPECGAKVN